MDKDSQVTTCSREQTEEERQNRRQFFNGLGKWSLAIIAAVTALRDGLHDVRSAIGSRLDAPPIGRSDPRQQIARKPTKTLPVSVPHADRYVESSHDDWGHYDAPPHADGMRK